MFFVQKKMLRFCDINIFDFLMRNRFQNLGPHYHYWGFIEAKTDYERPKLTMKDHIWAPRIWVPKLE